MSLLPNKQFWSVFIRKWIGFFCSLKVLFFLTATWLLMHSYITGTNWVAALSVILGTRFGNQIVYEYMNGNHSSKKGVSKKEDSVISQEDGI